MGDTLSPEVLRVFRKELEKEAGIWAAKSLGKEFLELGRRMRNPIQGIKKGIKSLSPQGLIEQGTERGAAILSAAKKTRAAQEQKGFRSALQRTFGTGAHLLPDGQKSKGIRGFAEGLSRQGVTGEGRVTKYIPIGEKGQLIGAGLMGAHGVQKAVREGPSSEGGAGEQLGRAIGYGGMGVLSAGLPGVGFLAPMLAGNLAGRTGRVVDQKFDPRTRGIEPGVPGRLQRAHQTRRGGQYLDSLPQTALAAGGGS